MTYLELPSGQLKASLLSQFDSRYPNREPLLNRELVKLLLTLQAEGIGKRTIQVLGQTATAMEQLHYLVQLNDANVTFSQNEQARLRSVLDLATIRNTGAQPYKNVGTMIQSLLSGVGDENKQPPETETKRVRQWKLTEVLELGNSWKSGDAEKGRAAFRKANCHNCHRVGTSGGVLGPNLTSLASRFKLRDVIVSIVDPDRVVADQYRTTIFRKVDGKEFTGQIVNLSKGVIQIRLDPLRPFPRVSFPEADIEEMRLSKTSLMPKGLLDVLTANEIRDLFAYLLAK